MIVMIMCTTTIMMINDKKDNFKDNNYDKNNNINNNQ